MGLDFYSRNSVKCKWRSNTLSKAAKIKPPPCGRARRGPNKKEKKKKKWILLQYIHKWTQKRTIHYEERIVHKHDSKKIQLLKSLTTNAQAPDSLVNAVKK